MPSLTKMFMASENVAHKAKTRKDTNSISKTGKQTRVDDDNSLKRLKKGIKTKV